MKMPDNTIASVREYFTIQLDTFYTSREIDQLFFIAAEFYLGLEKYELRLKEKDRLSESQLLLFVYCIKALKQHKPIQYILGEAPFYGLNFKINDQVLIPRPETEELVEWILEEHKIASPLKIIDIGTGSGCIAIALKKYLPNAEVYAMDISKGALKVAQQNAQLNEVAIHFIEDDILNLPQLDISFDIIVSNPPYIGKEEAIKMKENVLNYEPHLALFVENQDVLLFYKKIAEWASIHLSSDGVIYYELNESNGNELSDYLNINQFKSIIRKDLNEKDRMMKVER